MTHAAAANTPHLPRRRPFSPAAGERAGALAGVLGVVVVLMVTCIMASMPSVDSTPHAVRAYVSGHDTMVVASAYAMLVGAFLLVPFLVSVRMFTARRSDVGRWRWTVTLVLGAVGVAVLALAGALLLTATLLTASKAADDAVFAVLVAAKLAVTLALLPVAGVVLANAGTVAATQQRPDRWLLRFDIQIAVLAVTASVASFLDHGWLAPGAPGTAGAWLLVALWVTALARTIRRGDNLQPKEGS